MSILSDRWAERHAPIELRALAQAVCCQGALEPS